jgi:hypothetical protein
VHGDELPRNFSRRLPGRSDQADLPEADLRGDRAITYTNKGHAYAIRVALSDG